MTDGQISHDEHELNKPELTSESGIQTGSDQTTLVYKATETTITPQEKLPTLAVSQPEEPEIHSSEQPETQKPDIYLSTTEDHKVRQTTPVYQSVETTVTERGETQKPETHTETHAQPEVSHTTFTYKITETLQPQTESSVPIESHPEVSHTPSEQDMHKPETHTEIIDKTTSEITMKPQQETTVLPESLTEVPDIYSAIEEHDTKKPEYSPGSVSESHEVKTEKPIDLTTILYKTSETTIRPQQESSTIAESVASVTNIENITSEQNNQQPEIYSESDITFEKTTLPQRVSETTVKPQHDESAEVTETHLEPDSQHGVDQSPSIYSISEKTDRPQQESTTVSEFLPPVTDILSKPEQHFNDTEYNISESPETQPDHGVEQTTIVYKTSETTIRHTEITDESESLPTEKTPESSIIDEYKPTTLISDVTEAPQETTTHKIDKYIPETHSESETQHSIYQTTSSHEIKHTDPETSTLSESHRPSSDIIHDYITTKLPYSEMTTKIPLEEKYPSSTTKYSSTELEPDYGQAEIPALPSPDESNAPDFTGGYGSPNSEPDYEEEDQSFGPGTCRYGGKVYVSAQQIPRDDPCDFCFCFRSDIICLQQSCPPPIQHCHEEPIQGFCCPRYECPVSMALVMNVTTTTTTTTTTLPPHFLPHAYKGSAYKKGCQIGGKAYAVGEEIPDSSGPCLRCKCGHNGRMECDPKACQPEPLIRKMIAVAATQRRR